MRRSSRYTAGQHCNPQRLPVSAISDGNQQCTSVDPVGAKGDNSGSDVNMIAVHSRSPDGQTTMDQTGKKENTNTCEANVGIVPVKAVHRQTVSETTSRTLGML